VPEAIPDLEGIAAAKIASRERQRWRPARASRKEARIQPVSANAILVKASKRQ
jgi:hypothetical protein